MLALLFDFFCVYGSTSTQCRASYSICCETWMDCLLYTASTLQATMYTDSMCPHRQGKTYLIVRPPHTDANQRGQHQSSVHSLANMPPETPAASNVSRREFSTLMLRAAVRVSLT